MIDTEVPMPLVIAQVTHILGQGNGPTMSSFIVVLALILLAALVITGGDKNGRF
jgi:hypothetical protein